MLSWLTYSRSLAPHTSNIIFFFYRYDGSWRWQWKLEAVQCEGPNQLEVRVMGWHLEAFQGLFQNMFNIFNIYWGFSSLLTSLLLIQSFHCRFWSGQKLQKDLWNSFVRKRLVNFINDKNRMMKKSRKFALK